MTRALAFIVYHIVWCSSYSLLTSKCVCIITPSRLVNEISQRRADNALGRCVTTTSITLKRSHKLVINTFDLYVVWIRCSLVNVQMFVGHFAHFQSWHSHWRYDEMFTRMTDCAKKVHIESNKDNNWKGNNIFIKLIIEVIHRNILYEPKKNNLITEKLKLIIKPMWVSKILVLNVTNIFFGCYKTKLYLIDITILLGLRVFVMFNFGIGSTGLKMSQLFSYLITPIFHISQFNVHLLQVYAQYDIQRLPLVVITETNPVWSCTVTVAQKQLQTHRSSALIPHERDRYDKVLRTVANDFPLVPLICVCCMCVFYWWQNPQISRAGDTCSSIQTPNMFQCSPQFLRLRHIQVVVLDSCCVLGLMGLQHYCRGWWNHFDLLQSLAL